MRIFLEKFILPDCARRTDCAYRADDSNDAIANAANAFDFRASGGKQFLRSGKSIFAKSKSIGRKKR